MDARLLLLKPEEKAAEYTLRLPAVLGRGGDAILKIVHSSVSRRHCELSELDGQLAVRDLGSLNGTFVDERRVTDLTVLPPGGNLRLGGVEFRAIYGSRAELRSGDVAPTVPELPLHDSAETLHVPMPPPLVPMPSPLLPPTASPPSLPPAGSDKPSHDDLFFDPSPNAEPKTLDDDLNSLFKSLE